ncbi:ABC transporter substrate-binding protein [Nocardia sp. bgisy118]|uniref:ABC transporter substrate-binding protein n=1 Tax=Nocardia sp. bgisy118 TaxID=3413786 RepID=UPI003F49F97A
MASYGDTPALIARGSGLQTRLPAINAVGLNAVVVVKDPSITSLKDLAGKKTACRPAPTSTGICKARCAKRASRPS